MMQASKTVFKCVRKVHFSAGHRVLGHESRCASPHGHNYYAHISAEALDLDSLGRVVDFSVIKEKVGGWVDEFWDHSFLVYEKDVHLINALLMVPAPKKPFVCPFNPTAENMARYLLETVSPKVLAGLGVAVTKVVIHETDNCYAEASLCRS